MRAAPHFWMRWHPSKQIWCEVRRSRMRCHAHASQPSATWQRWNVPSPHCCHDNYLPAALSGFLSPSPIPDEIYFIMASSKILLRYLNFKAAKIPLVKLNRTIWTHPVTSVLDTKGVRHSLFARPNLTLLRSSMAGKVTFGNCYFRNVFF